jgi:arsenate reductase-like glutaredoxin family protein
MTLPEIQKLTEAFSAEHRRLTRVVQDVETEIAAVRRKWLKTIMNLVALTATRKAELLAALEASPKLFEKPRTQTFDGVKVGYQKQKGKLTIPDEQKTVDRIYEMFPEDAADVYVKIEHTPVKAALEKLDAATLKKLGIQVTADGDSVVIKTLDSEIEKIVAALLDVSDQSDTSEKKEAA